MATRRQKTNMLEKQSHAKLKKARTEAKIGVQGAAARLAHHQAKVKTKPKEAAPGKR